MTGEAYVSKIELERGVLGTLAIAQGSERAVLLRSVSQGAEWSAGALDEWAKLSVTAERIHHPSLLAVIDVQRQPDGLTIATEYVQGLPLSVLMARAAERKRAIPVDVAERVVLELARAIGHAERLLTEAGQPGAFRWVHPEAVLVTSGDDALLADVGLLGLDTVTEDARALAFRAPELLGGRPACASSIVYSLGILLWELVAGRSALGEWQSGSSPDEARQRAVAGAVPKLELVAPNAPPLLCGIVGQALHRDPPSRFPDVDSFVQALSAGKRPSPGLLVRFMNELCGDLIDAQRGAVARPQAVAQSWRPTFHPGDAELEIPKAPKALGLAAFKEPVKPSEAIVISDKPAGAEAGTPAGASPEPPAPHAPQATLPLILVNKPRVPVREAEAVEEETPDAIDRESEPNGPPPRRRAGLAILVLLIVAGAGALLVTALREPRVSAEDNSVAPPATLRPSVPAATASAAQGTSASSVPAPGTAPSARPRARREREEPRRERKKDAGFVSDWGKVEEDLASPTKSEAPPPPTTPPAVSSAFGY